MRVGLVLALLSLLAGCDRADQRPVPEPTATPGEPSQASIIRPDFAPPTSEPPPLEPLDLTIGFPEGEAALGPAQIAKLTEFAASPQVAQGGPIRLEGHSDSSGSDAANLAASRERAEAVRDWLVDQGVAEERITLIAFGEQNPARPNALPDGAPDEAGRAANRRVEIHAPVAAAPAAEPREPTLAEEIVETAEDTAVQGEQAENSD